MNNQDPIQQLSKILAQPEVRMSLMPILVMPVISDDNIEDFRRLWNERSYGNIVYSVDTSEAENIKVVEPLPLINIEL